MTAQSPIIHTIEFEGIRLPRFASFLDVAASVLPVSEATSVWFWRFTICAGTHRDDTSASILVHAEELLAALPPSSATFRSVLAERFPGCDSEAILSDWHSSLKHIIATAQTRDCCHWFGDAK